MSRTPLNPTGGEAAVVKARVPTSDIVRLRRLATSRRKSRSAMTRELLRFALDLLERAQPPPDGG